MEVIVVVIGLGLLILSVFVMSMFNVIRGIQEFQSVQAEHSRNLINRLDNVGNLVATLASRDESVMEDVNLVVSVDHPTASVLDIHMIDGSIVAQLRSDNYKRSEYLSTMLNRATVLKTVATIICPTKCSTKKPRGK